MSSGAPAWIPSKGRKSRLEAEQALIDAVIDLVDHVPIAEITIHHLASEAKVNFGYVNRYFESRLNLFAAATDELADRGMAQLRFAVANRTVVQRNDSKDLSDDDLLDVRRQLVPIGVKRLQIVQFLVACGVPTERFVVKSQEVLTTAIEVITNAGMDPAVARARVIHGISMMWATATLGPILGVTARDLHDSYASIVPSAYTDPRSPAPDRP